MCCVSSRFSGVPLLATLWTAACQAPQSMRFSKQAYWSGLPCPPPGDLPHQGIKPGSPALQADSLLLSHQGNPFGSADQSSPISSAIGSGSIWNKPMLQCISWKPFTRSGALRCLVAQSCPTLCNPMDCSQAPLSMGFSRQEYWSELPCPSLGDLPNPGFEASSPELQADSLPSEPLGKPDLQMRKWAQILTAVTLPQKSATASPV